MHCIPVSSLISDRCIISLNTHPSSTPQLNALTRTVSSNASRHPLYSFAKRRKEAAIYEGALSRGGWLDRVVFAGSRSWAESLTAVVLVNSGMFLLLEASGRSSLLKVEATALHPKQLADALVHLSVPIIRTLKTPQAAGPICATHHHDYQLVPFDEQMHVGPPAAGIEIELRGEERQFADASIDPQGMVSRCCREGIESLISAIRYSSRDPRC